MPPFRLAYSMLSRPHSQPGLRPWLGSPSATAIQCQQRQHSAYGLVWCLQYTASRSSNPPCAQGSRWRNFTQTGATSSCRVSTTRATLSRRSLATLSYSSHSSQGGQHVCPSLTSLHRHVTRGTSTICKQPETGEFCAASSRACATSSSSRASAIQPTLTRTIRFLMRLAVDLCIHGYR